MLARARYRRPLAALAVTIMTGGAALSLATVIATSAQASARTQAEAAPAPTTDGGAAVAEAQFVSRVNDLRAAQGLGALRIDPLLTQVARDWATDLSRRNCVCHHPEFLTGNPDDAAKVVPTNWVKLGENVGTGSNPDQIEDAFERSPLHRKNILDADFDTIGIGVVIVNGGLWVSQQFEDLPGRSPGQEALSLSTAAAPDQLAQSAAPHRATARTTSPAARVPRATAARTSPARRRRPKSATTATTTASVGFAPARRWN